MSFHYILLHVETISPAWRKKKLEGTPVLTKGHKPSDTFTIYRKDKSGKIIKITKKKKSIK